MKKTLILLLSIGMMLSSQAQLGKIFGGGFSGIVYDPTNYGVAIKTLVETKVQIDKMIEHIDIAIKTKDQVTDIWQMQEDIRQRLYGLNGMKDLRWNDLQNLFEQAMLLGSDPRSYFRYQIPHLQTFSDLINQVGDPESARNLYEWFYEKTTAYDPPENLGDLLKGKAAQAGKRYAAEMFAQKQKMQIAMGYMREADEQAIKAEELRQKASSEGAMSMTEAERALVLQAANTNMIRSMNMREKANQLYSKALEKGPAQRLIDWQHHTKLSRASKARLLPLLLPGT